MFNRAACLHTTVRILRISVWRGHQEKTFNITKTASVVDKFKTFVGSIFKTNTSLRKSPISWSLKWYKKVSAVSLEIIKDFIRKYIQIIAIKLEDARRFRATVINEFHHHHFVAYSV